MYITSILSSYATISMFVRKEILHAHCNIQFVIQIKVHNSIFLLVLGCCWIFFSPGVFTKT